MSGRDAERVGDGLGAAVAGLAAVDGDFRDGDVAAAAESRNVTSAATSSGWPARLSGVWDRLAARNAGDADAVIGVSMNPGWIELTRMLLGTSSIEATWDRPRSAHLLVV